MDDKLGKIIALAREGIGGEKTAAIKIVRRLCAAKGLDFDEIMAGTTTERLVRYNFKYVTPEERIIIFRVLSKFGQKEFWIVTRYKWVVTEATPAQYIELSYAVDAFLRAYRKERKKLAQDLQQAFVMKHRLWADDAPSADMSKMTPEDFERMLRAEAMSMTLEDVNVTKQIEGVSRAA